jgi:hypothetical protein
MDAIYPQVIRLISVYVYILVHREEAARRVENAQVPMLSVELRLTLVKSVLTAV